MTHTAEYLDPMQMVPLEFVEHAGGRQAAGCDSLWEYFIGSRPAMISLPDVPCCYSVTRIIFAHSSSLLHIRSLPRLLADSSFLAFSSKNDSWLRELAG